jgi:hypothetical protein
VIDLDESELQQQRAESFGHIPRIIPLELITEEPESAIGIIFICFDLFEKNDKNNEKTIRYSLVYSNAN